MSLDVPSHRDACLVFSSQLRLPADPMVFRSPDPSRISGREIGGRLQVGGDCDDVGVTGVRRTQRRTDAMVQDFRHMPWAACRRCP